MNKNDFVGGADASPAFRVKGRCFLKRRWKSPYLIDYLSFAMICCVLLSALFLFINFHNVKKMESVQNQKKAELVCKMLEEHLETQTKIAYQISQYKEFQPYYLRQQKYNEIEMLESFKQKNSAIVLDGLAFLYYAGDNNMYCSTGYLQSLEQYFNTLGYNDEQRMVMMTALVEIGNGFQIIHIKEQNYFMRKVKVRDTSGFSSAVYVVAISDEQMDERIQLVSGGMRGSYAIYLKDKFISGDETIDQDNRNAVSAQTGYGGLCLVWIPESAGFFEDMLPLQILLILSALIVILMIGSFFARKSYAQVKSLAEKYHGEVFRDETHEFKNSIEELDTMIDKVISSNTAIKNQLVQKQILLQKQILRMVLNDSYLFAGNTDANQVGILFPGNAFWVISILLGENEDTSKLSIIEKQIELIKDGKEGHYVDALSDSCKRAVYVLCAVNEMEDWQELQDEVYEVAESFGWSLKIGCGMVYKELSKISASYLESLDNIQKYKQSQEQEKGFIYNASEICVIIRELTGGNEETARNLLYSYLEKLRSNRVSLLMQQYIFSNFISEISKIAHDNQVELEAAKISLLVSSSSLESFQEAAEIVIHDICVQVNEKKKRIEADAEYQVCYYIQKHFSDYDISIEKVAQELNTNEAFVRNTVKEKTGKSYKEYLIYLRIEYAKELLETSEMAVAEVCEKVGYGNISYFIKLFRTTTGVTPSAWRKGKI